MKTTPALQFAKSFAQFIAHVHRYKCRAEVLRRLNAKLQKPVRASDVHRWLHPDPKSRTEPRWGIGTLLLAVWEEMLRDLVAEREKHGWWWKSQLGWHRFMPPSGYEMVNVKWIMLSHQRTVPDCIGDPLP